MASSRKDADRKKGPWSPEEDETLQRLVQNYGQRSWSIISKSIPGRSLRSCRLRWCNQLSPEVQHKFLPEERRGGEVGGGGGDGGGGSGDGGDGSGEGRDGGDGSGGGGDGSRGGGSGGGGGRGGGSGGNSGSGSPPDNRDADGNGSRDKGGDGGGGKNGKISFKEKGGYDNRTGKRPGNEHDFPVGQLIF